MVVACALPLLQGCAGSSDPGVSVQADLEVERREERVVLRVQAAPNTKVWTQARGEEQQSDPAPFFDDRVAAAPAEGVVSAVTDEAGRATLVVPVTEWGAGWSAEGTKRWRVLTERAEKSRLRGARFAHAYKDVWVTHPAGIRAWPEVADVQVRGFGPKPFRGTIERDLSLSLRDVDPAATVEFGSKRSDPTTRKPKPRSTEIRLDPPADLRGVIERVPLRELLAKEGASTVDLPLAVELPDGTKSAGEVAIPVSMLRWALVPTFEKLAKGPLRFAAESPSAGASRSLLLVTPGAEAVLFGRAVQLGEIDLVAVVKHASDTLPCGDYRRKDAPGNPTLQVTAVRTDADVTVYERRTGVVRATRRFAAPTRNPCPDVMAATLRPGQRAAWADGAEYVRADVAAWAATFVPTSP